jgi:D-sedoheptulose 7-phosphate isomerase
MNDKVKQIYASLFQYYPALAVCQNAIEQAFLTLQTCYQNQGKLLICGNGGSGADAEHIVGELMKSFMLKRPIQTEQQAKLKALFPTDGAYLAEHLQGALPAIALTGHLALSTAFLNDVAGDMVFAQQVYGYAQSVDVLLAISTSGNSKNVLNALKVAKALNLKTIGLTGQHGGQMNHLCDIVVRVPAGEVYVIQEYHLPVYHTLCRMLEAEFFAQPAQSS